MDAIDTDLADEKRFLNLYKIYRNWDKRIINFLEDGKARDFSNVEIFNKWMSVEQIYPEPVSMDANVNQRIINNRIAHKNIEELRNVLSQKRIVLGELRKHLSQGNEKERDQTNMPIFYFSNDGRVYSDFEEGFSLVQNKNPYTLLRRLIKKSPNYIPTSILVDDLESTPRSVRETVRSIRSQFVENFQGVKRKDIIESKPGSGYRLSNKIKILLDK